MGILPSTLQCQQKEKNENWGKSDALLLFAFLIKIKAPEKLILLVCLLKNFPPQRFFLHFLFIYLSKTNRSSLGQWRWWKEVLASPFYASSIFIIICNRRNNWQGTARRKVRGKKLLFIPFLSLAWFACNSIYETLRLGFFLVHSRGKLRWQMNYLWDFVVCVWWNRFR